MHLIRIEEPGQYAIELRKDAKRGRYVVQYGHEITPDLKWEQAALTLGACVFHALECAGKVERNTKH